MSCHAEFDGNRVTMSHRPHLQSAPTSNQTRTCARASRRRWARGTKLNGRAAAWVIILAAVFHGSAAGSGWRPVMPVSGGAVNQVVVDPTGVVYATSNSGIFKSTDSGQTWTSATGDLPVLAVQTVTADPVNAGTLYVGTTLAIYKTVNGGLHWSLLMTIPTGTQIGAIAVARSNPNYVYALTGGSYAYRSTDGGATWAQSSSGLSGGSSGPSYLTVMAVDPTNPLRVYTNTWRGQLFRSDDGANTWNLIGGGGTYWIFQLAIAPSTPNVLWARNDAAYTSYGNVLKSTDYGATWSNAGQPAGTEDGGGIAISPTNPNVAYVATSQGLYMTSGGGVWTLVLAPPGQPALSSVAINPANASQFYAGSSFWGPYLSMDGGVTWGQSVSGFAAASITDIALCPASPSILYAAAQTAGLLKSGDGGLTWAVVDTAAGFQSQYLQGVGVHPSDPDQVLLSSGSNIWRSTNGGVSFSSAASYGPGWIRFNPLNPNNVYASIADWQGGFLFSGSAGASWSIPQSIYIYPHDYAFHPAYSNVVLAGAEQYTGAAIDTTYIMWSNSGGNGGWQQSAAIGGGGLVELALDQNNPTILYAVGQLLSESTQGVYKFSVSYSGSTVTGVTRIPGTFNSGLGGAVARRIVYNTATSTLYLTTDHGVFQSTNQAATWTPMNAGLAYLSTGAIAVSPDASRIIAGTNGGLWEYDATVSAPTITTSSPLPSGIIGTSYSQTLAATGGTPSYTWSVVAGTVPPGLVLSSAGVLTGTPTVAGAYVFTVQVADRTSAVATQSFALVINAVPVLSIASTHTGSFTQGQNSATYSVTVSNAAAAGATSGTVTVTETVPSGLTLVSMSGTGWTCPSGGTTCTRSDSLAAGASYAAITVTVNVASNAASPQVNSVSVSGGGSAAASATDSTVIQLLPGSVTLAGASFFGGAGDQAGVSIFIANSTVYAGTDGGQLLRYPIPPGLPNASSSLGNAWIGGLGVSGNVVYGVGSAVPPACGAVDTVGDVEGKTLLARYDATTGALLGCQSANIFPYSGGENYSAVLNASSYVYAAGAGETCGFGNNTFLLSKFAASGAVQGTVGEPGTNFSGYSCYGGSSSRGLGLLNGNLYVAGGSNLSGEDGVLRPVLMKYDTSLNRLWKQRPTDNQGGYFNGVVALNGAVYAIGYVTVGSNSRFLIEKYD